MQQTQAQKGALFRDLHTAEGIFVMPNAWNAGSACMLESAGFPAIGTTSAGIAYSAGIPDTEGVLTRDAALEETRRISAAVDVPVSADAENCYGHEPEAVAECIRLFAEAGVVGASIEDYSADFGDTLYEVSHAVERVRAAKEAAESVGFPFTLTARSECYLIGHPEPFEESVKRVKLYREAGADCLYVPGIKDAEIISAMVREVDGPINVVVGLAGNPLSLSELEALGVKRVSIGGALARTTFAVIRRATDEIRAQGTFTFAKEQIPDRELCGFFSDRFRGRSGTGD